MLRVVNKNLLIEVFDDQISAWCIIEFANQFFVDQIADTFPHSTSTFPSIPDV
jgi:hypothetical protein